MKHVLFGFTAVIASLSASAYVSPTYSQQSAAAPAQVTKPIAKVDELAALVPEKFRKKGTITASVNADVPPVKFIDEDGKIVGLAPDLFVMAAQTLGLEPKLETGAFDAMIPGLQAQRFDMILSMADWKDRQARVTFVDYLKSGVSLVALKESNITVKSRADLCGRSVAISRGTKLQEDIVKIGADCKAAGKKEPEVVTYQDSSTILLALPSKAADLGWVDLTIASYNVNKSDKFEIVYTEYTAPNGMGFLKGEEDMAKAWQAALQYLDKEGHYKAALGKWGLQDDAMPGFPINGGPEPQK